MHPVIFANSSAFTGTSLRHVCVEFFQEMWPGPLAELYRRHNFLMTTQGRTSTANLRQIQIAIDDGTSNLKIVVR